MLGRRHAVWLFATAASATPASPDAAFGTLSDGSHCRASNDVIAIDFAAASVMHSNLGNHGPDFAAPPTVRLANVGRIEGSRIDLEVSNLTFYPPPAANVKRAASK